MRHTLVTLSLMAALSAPALADEGGAVAGAATGAVAGAVVGGPVGAAVGAGVGGVVGGTASDASRAENRTTIVTPNTTGSVTRQRTCVENARGDQTCQEVAR